MLEIYFRLKKDLKLFKINFLIDWWGSDWSQKSCQINKIIFKIDPFIYYWYWKWSKLIFNNQMCWGWERNASFYKWRSICIRNDNIASWSLLNTNLRWFQDTVWQWPHWNDISINIVITYCFQIVAV